MFPRVSRRVTPISPHLFGEKKPGIILFKGKRALGGDSILLVARRVHIELPGRQQMSPQLFFVKQLFLGAFSSSTVNLGLLFVEGLVFFAQKSQQAGHFSSVHKKVGVCFFCKKVHPRKQTWNLKTPPWKRRNIYKPPIFGFHVCFRGCTLWYFLT